MRRLAFFRYFSYSALLLLLYLLQSTPRLLPELFGSKPMLMVPLALCIASFENKIPSLVFGAVCGALTDLACSSGVGFFAIALTLVCYFEAHIFEKYFVSGFFSVMLFSFCAICCLTGVYFLLFKLSIQGAGTLFVNHYISRIIYTSASVAAVYLITKFLSGLREQR